MARHTAPYKPRGGLTAMGEAALVLTILAGLAAMADRLSVLTPVVAVLRSLLGTFV